MKFPKVTLLITHYNRSQSLEELLDAFQDLGCEFGGVVVSDDGSKKEHLDALNSLREKFKFNLVTTPVNRGLGNNINKGQDAVKTEYTLYIQEDFIPKPVFPEKLADALSFMELDDTIDLVRFHAYFKYPYLKPYKNGFSEMAFKIWKPGYRKFFCYSDHPHLRRSDFFEKFGRYPEGLKGDPTEYKMMMSFLKNKGKSLYFDDPYGLFEHENSEEEPSTMKRNYWRESKNPFITLLRNGYRHLKYNLDYLF